MDHLQPARSKTGGAAMSELSDKNFGLLVAYVLPGFVGLWGISHFSATVDSWITTSQTSAPTVAGFLYVTLASLAAGLVVSAIRWAIVDSLHHATGVKPPNWEFANLDDRLEAFLALVANHYRFYQFYGGMFVSGFLAYAAYFISHHNQCQLDWSTLGFILLETTMFAGSRDSLKKYYSRVERLLGTLEPSERSVSHDQRFSQEGREAQEDAEGIDVETEEEQGG